MFAGKVKTIGSIAAVAALSTLAGPVSQASANNAGGDGFKHSAITACGSHSMSVDVVAAGSYNGQLVATRLWVRVPGGQWSAMGDWRYTNVYPVRSFGDGFGGTIQSVTPQTLYTQNLTTNGGYREVGVQFYWLVNGAWTGYDFFVEDTYAQASPLGSLVTGTCVT
jgi:hypothetical protein